MIIKIGDTIRWRGAFGYDDPKTAKIIYLELCENEHEKYGVPVEFISIKDKNRTIFDLDNGHWAYGSQIEIILD